ncbi:MAG: glycosyltransferase family 39 protein [Salibacteraceae bacterium]
MKWKNEILLILFSALLFMPFLGTVHLFDWDEINFAESAREMLLTNNWFLVQVNFEPFWEKPPLFFWLQALSMKAFGIGEFAARLPNAICGIVTVFVLYRIGKQHHNARFGLLWAFLYIGSFLPHLYFKSGIIDPWFNLFIFLSIYFLYRIIQFGDRLTYLNAILAGLFSGLAILTKGPVGFLLLLLTFLVWWSFNRFKKPAKFSVVLTFGVVTLAVSTFWFGLETWNNGPWFLVEFISYQIDLFLNPVAGHKQPFFYHFLVVLMGCFPLSVLAIPSFHRGFQGDSDRFSKWMKYLFWVVLILFSISTTKIVHYSSMTYLPLSYLSALVTFRLIMSKTALPKWQRIWILFQGILIGVGLTLAPILLMNRNYLLSRISDPFVRGNLTAPVDYFGWEWMIGLIYISVVIIAVIKSKTRLKQSVYILSLGTAATLFVTMPLIVPMIESISQRSAVTFFKAQQGKDVYLKPYGYKSYAHLFYGKVTPETSHKMDQHKLDNADKPVLISLKINRLEQFNKAYPNAILIGEQGGFAFYKLNPP